MAAKSTEDKKGREIFLRLAEEEMEHVDFLKKQFTSVIENGEPDAAALLEMPSDLSALSPIFSENLHNRIRDAHFEMTALSVGIHLELNSSDFYSKAASEAEDPVVQRFYKVLAKWELGHYRALVAEQETLKKDYWYQNGFMPF
jgi:rubrerythrin